MSIFVQVHYYSLCFFDEPEGLVPMFHELTSRDIVQTNVEVLELLRVEVVYLLGDVEYVLHSASV